MSNKTQDRAAMAKAAQQVEAKTQEIHALQKRLGGQVQELMVSWKGNAANAFRGGYQQFDREFEKVKQGLDQIHDSLVHTQRAYTVREQENVETANQIAKLLG